MQEPAPFAITPDGTQMICGDGPELLVYHGDGQPSWKAFGEGILIGVGTTADMVVAADADGRVRWYRRADGRLVDSAEIGQASAALAVGEDGRAAVVVGAGVALVARGGQPHVLAMPGASAVAFGPGGGSLGIGSTSGTFQAIDTGSGAAWGQVSVGAPITGVAWSQLGFWVVSAGHGLFLVSGDGTTVTHTLGDQEGPLSEVVVSGDGLLAAALLGHNQVAVFELHGVRRIGNVDFRRRIGGVSFGPGGQLGIGLDDGDASRVDLHGGGAIRTEPHPGRGRNNWNLDLKIDHAAVRGALALNKAGGTPIAAYTGWKPSDEEEERGWGRTCLVSGLGCALVTFGCTGFAVLAWVLHRMGWF